MSKGSKAKSIWASVLLVTLIIISVCSALVIISLAFAPEVTKKTAGEIITRMEKAASDVGVTPPPVIILGEPGGQAELDYCDGTWVEMVGYQSQDLVSPVYSAHNGCGGNPILALSEGDTILVRQVNGEQAEYRMTSERIIPQRTSTTGDLVGMDGDLLLQTCFWDDATMRIVGLTPVG